MTDQNILRVALAQMSPIWLNKEQTVDKVSSYVADAGNKHCDLVTFGEGVLPGYPFWISLTNGAAFNSLVQKELYAHYVKNAVNIEAGDLEPVCGLAKEKRIAVYLGTIERAQNRGGHSLYASLAYINQQGIIKSVHRKLQPTYEERLTWAPGDGAGLQVHALKQFCLGGLNCWENWMSLARTALYGQGENVHVAVWPGSKQNTVDITKFIAKESRSYVISVSGLMRIQDFPQNTPHLDKILENAPETLANGGSCIAGPDGEWVTPPVADKERLIVAELDYDSILQERQNFDIAGHYSRPDVTKLIVNRQRQAILDIRDE
jgi:nitrilase